MDTGRSNGNDRTPFIRRAARLLCVILICRAFPGGASTVREMEKQIKAQKKDLEKLQTRLESLESEKRKLKRDEEGLSRTLKKYESELEQSTRRQVRLNRQIRETVSQIKHVGGDVRHFSSERSKWEDSILSDVRLYYVQSFAPQRFMTDPLESWATRALVALKFSNMKSAENRKDAAQDRQARLLGYQANLTLLQAKLKEEIGRQKSTQAEKKRLYQTTLGKRLIAEQEVARLRETSESLEQLVVELIRKKEKTLAAQKEAELLKKSFRERRGNFSWPVSGEVVSRFGRQKHPDLNITVINSGIRLKAEQGDPVRSVEKGMVVYAADFRSYGQTVIVDHGGDLYSIYGLLGNIQVKDGEKVKAGDVLGSSQGGDDSQVYFEFKNQGHSEDPLLWLSPR